MITKKKKPQRRERLANKSFFKDYSVVKNGKHFFLAHKKASDPFDEKDSQYLLVFKKYSTIEARAGSYIMACDYLVQADEMAGALASPSTEVKEKPTLQ